MQQPFCIETGAKTSAVVLSHPFGQAHAPTAGTLGQPLRHLGVQFQQRRVNMLPRGRLQRSRVGLCQLGLDDIEIDLTHHALTPLFQASPSVRWSRRDCQSVALA
jgi:hypothetical protein